VGTGEEVRRITVPAKKLSGLLFSPDGRVLAARAVDGALILWEAGTGKEVRRIKPPQQQPMGNGVVLILGGGAGAASAMAFTPDGKVLAAGATENTGQAVTSSIKFWDLATGKEVRKIEAPENVGVSAVAIAPGGEVMAYGGGDAVRLCEVKTGKEVRKLEIPGGVRSLAFAPDGKTLAVRGPDQHVSLWEVQTGKERRRLSDAQPAQPIGAPRLGLT